MKKILKDYFQEYYWVKIKPTDIILGIIKLPFYIPCIIFIYPFILTADWLNEPDKPKEDETQTKTKSSTKNAKQDRKNY